MAGRLGINISHRLSVPFYRLGVLSSPLDGGQGSDFEAHFTYFDMNKQKCFSSFNGHPVMFTETKYFDATPRGRKAYAPAILIRNLDYAWGATSDFKAFYHHDTTDVWYNPDGLWIYKELLDPSDPSSGEVYKCNNYYRFEDFCTEPNIYSDSYYKRFRRMGIFPGDYVSKCDSLYGDYINKTTGEVDFTLHSLGVYVGNSEIFYGETSSHYVGQGTNEIIKLGEENWMLKFNGEIFYSNSVIGVYTQNGTDNYIIVESGPKMYKTKLSTLSRSTQL